MLLLCSVGQRQLLSRPGSAGQDEDRDPGRGDGGGGRGH